MNTIAGQYFLQFLKYVIEWFAKLTEEGEGKKISNTKPQNHEHRKQDKIGGTKVDDTTFLFMISFVVIYYILIYVQRFY